MQLQNATILEKELYEILLLWEQEPASEFQTRVSNALSSSMNELQRLRFLIKNVFESMLRGY